MANIVCNRIQKWHQKLLRCIHVPYRLGEPNSHRFRRWYPVLSDVSSCRISIVRLWRVVVSNRRERGRFSPDRYLGGDELEPLDVVLAVQDDQPEAAEPLHCNYFRLQRLWRRLQLTWSISCYKSGNPYLLVITDRFTKHTRTVSFGTDKRI